MREIGGYFQLEEFTGGEYYKGLIALNNGRNALLYLLEAKEISKLYIPLYLCETVSEMLKKYKIEYEFYRVDNQFMPIFNTQLKEDECLYIVNLYGQLDDNKIKQLKERHEKIIMDHTHSFFQKPLEGVDTIYSCRKFFGVPDGAYLATSTKQQKELEVDHSRDRMSHLLGRYEGKASDFYEEFIKNNIVFDDEPLKAMSKLTRNLLNGIDYERIRTIRNRNYKFLAEQLGSENKLQLISPDGAFAYPFYQEKGREIRKKLAEQKIYIPLLWPNVLEVADQASLEYQYAANILPLPCDQRYNLEDLGYMIEKITTIIK